MSPLELLAWILIVLSILYSAINFIGMTFSSRRTRHRQPRELSSQLLPFT